MVDKKLPEVESPGAEADRVREGGDGDVKVVRCYYVTFDLSCPFWVMTSNGL